MVNNNIQIFENQELGKIRVLTVEGQPWWVLKDVCSVLGIKNHKTTSSRLDEDEVGSFDLPHPQNPDKWLKMTCVSESGLYAAILRSEKAKARDFRKWITSQVLPSIRRHGAYITDEILKKMRESEEFADNLVELLTAEKLKNNALAAFANAVIPKAHYHDIVLKCPYAVQVSVIAKDYGMGAAKFNKLLHSLRVQFRIGKTWLLYQAHQGNGYTVTNTYTKNGMATLVHTCWTQRGRYWLYGLLKAHGILPIAEKMSVCQQTSLDDAKTYTTAVAGS